ncbi:MAG TPA: DUF3572 domain-containing protein [Rhizobiaceae bacterium]|nr:DUF3572 domain-containing protein [Rhizobiaceae bacterium]
MPRNADSTARDKAAELAVAALSWIAGDPAMLARFLGVTGISAGAIREAAREPGFLAGVLDFIAAHEPTLHAFCDATEADPALIMQARRALGDSNDDRWDSA